MRNLLFLYSLASAAVGLAQDLSLPPAYLSTFTLSESPRPIVYRLPSNTTGRVAFGTPSSTGAAVSIAASTTEFHAQTASEMQVRMESICSRLERMDLNGYLFHLPRTSDNRIVNTSNDIVEPEIVRIGKVSLAATPITAWKRKNPLCLLNPLVVDFSW